MKISDVIFGIVMLIFFSPIFAGLLRLAWLVLTGKVEL